MGLLRVNDLKREYKMSSFLSLFRALRLISSFSFSDSNSFILFIALDNSDSMDFCLFDVLSCDLYLSIEMSRISIISSNKLVISLSILSVRYLFSSPSIARRIAWRAIKASVSELHDIR